MAEVFLPRERIRTLLSESPALIAAATDGVDTARLRTAPAMGEWSVTEILAHLRACADVWGACIATILTEERPTIRAVSPRTWIRRTNYLDLEFRASLQAFSGQRAELLAALEPWAPEAWLRPAVVTGSGRVLERNVYWYAHGLATHERSHVKQIQRITTTFDAMYEIGR